MSNFKHKTAEEWDADDVEAYGQSEFSEALRAFGEEFDEWEGPAIDRIKPAYEVFQAEGGILEFEKFNDAFITGWNKALIRHKKQDNEE